MTKKKRHPSYGNFLSSQLEVRGFSLKQYYDDKRRGCLYATKRGEYEIYLLPIGQSHLTGEWMFEFVGFGGSAADVIRYFHFPIYSQDVVDALFMLEHLHLRYGEKYKS